MSLSELYTLTKLPRVFSALEKVHVARNSDENTLSLGVSGASISNYILKPSPKLIWSHSIPPNYSITSIDNLGELYFAGVYNTTSKKNSLLVVEKLENDSRIVKQIEVSSKIINLKRFDSGETVLVCEDAVVCLRGEEFSEAWRISNLYNGIFSEFITENNLLLMVELNKKKQSLNFKIISCQEGLEVNSRIIENPKKLNNLAFSYFDGILYQYSSTNSTLKLFNLPHFQLVNEFDLLKDFDGIELNSTDKVTLSSPAKDRLVVCQSNSVYLINLKFKILIDSKTSKHKISNIIIPPVKVKHRDTLIFGIVVREFDVAGISISIGSNTLKDSIGKKHHKANTSVTELKLVSDIFDIKDEKISLDASVLSDDPVEFEDNLLKFMGNKKGYYLETDRVVNSKFLQIMVQHSLQLSPLPEKGLTYLLTHPLFPYIEGLLGKLEENPRLLRQAIVTSNLSVADLLQELNTTDNDDIFKDIITRLLEFPKDKLNFKDLDSYRIVERIINLNFGYELVSLLIDASGLLTWGSDLIDKLDGILANKITALNSSANVLTVIEQLETNKLKSAEATDAKVPVYSVEHLAV